MVHKPWRWVVSSRDELVNGNGFTCLGCACSRYEVRPLALFFFGGCSCARHAIGKQIKLYGQISKLLHCCGPKSHLVSSQTPEEEEKNDKKK